jgi:hypothetical protein
MYMTLNHELNYLWQGNGNLVLNFVITDMGCLAICIDVTQHIDVLNINLLVATRLVSENEIYGKKQRSKGSFGCGNCNFDQTTDTLPNYENGKAQER